MKLKSVVLILICLLALCWMITGCTDKPHENETVAPPVPSAPVGNSPEKDPRPADSGEMNPVESKDVYTSNEGTAQEGAVGSNTEETTKVPFATLEVEDEIAVTYDSGIAIGGN